MRRFSNVQTNAQFLAIWQPGWQWNIWLEELNNGQLRQYQNWSDWWKTDCNKNVVVMEPPTVIRHMYMAIWR